jgi:NDP-sugar pyrophosphorylase family protein
MSLPKPLMPVGNHPILEILIRQLKHAKIDKIIIAVGYLESLIRAYFGDGSKFGVEIIYSSESIPLGTAGPLSLLRSYLDETFFFLNGDILTDIPFYSLLDFHRRERALATVAVSKRNVEIDFGVIGLDPQKRFRKWEEKPILEYFVSMGIYAFEPKVLEFLQSGYYNVPDLIVALHNANEKVAVYVHPGYWLDIGRPSDYQVACETVVNGEIKIE